MQHPDASLAVQLCQMGCLQSSGKGKNHYVVSFARLNARDQVFTHLCVFVCVRACVQTRAEARDVLADALRTMSMDLIAIVCGYVGVPIAKRGTSPRLLLGFGSSGDGDGQFRNPCFGVACGPGGQIYVSSGSAVQAFSEDGKFLQHIGKGDWKSATGIAFAHGEAYIADRTARSIAVCRDGSVVRRIGSEHMHRGTEVKNHGGDSDRQFLEPGFLAIDSKQQLLFVTEFAHDRVQVLKLDGTFVRGWGGSGSEEGQFVGPLGIAVSPLGEVAVADSRNCRIQVGLCCVLCSIFGLLIYFVLCAGVRLRRSVFASVRSSRHSHRHVS